jgi:predicted transcriptional regulator
LSEEGKQSAPWPKRLGRSDQTLHNWLKAETAGGLRELTSKAVSAEQMETAPLTAELAKTRVAWDPKRSGGEFARASR